MSALLKSLSSSSRYLLATQEFTSIWQIYHWKVGPHLTPAWHLMLFIVSIQVCICPLQNTLISDFYLCLADTCDEEDYYSNVCCDLSLDLIMVQCSNVILFRLTPAVYQWIGLRMNVDYCLHSNRFWIYIYFLFVNHAYNWKHYNQCQIRKDTKNTQHTCIFF